MKELLKVFHYSRNKNTLPKGNSLCYKGEKDGHGQPQEQPLIEGNLPDLFEIFPIPFNAGELVGRQSGKK